ncbi:hypothetical protein PGIGA_G00240930, partial [Pangasianodon gigas]|nr:hypothetical protein [Pangasianodon gigas]
MNWIIASSLVSDLAVVFTSELLLLCVNRRTKGVLVKKCMIKSLPQLQYSLMKGLHKILAVYLLMMFEWIQRFLCHHTPFTSVYYLEMFLSLSL